MFGFGSVDSNILRMVNLLNFTDFQIKTGFFLTSHHVMYSHPAYFYWLMVHALQPKPANKSNHIHIKKSEKKSQNLLHQGQGVQEGREVQAVQDGRGYHRYQGDQQDPAM